MIRHPAVILLSALVGCATTPPPSEPAAPPVPEPRFTQLPLAGARGVAAWRPATLAHVLTLDGQTCAYRELTLHCQPPASRVPAPTHATQRGDAVASVAPTRPDPPGQPVAAARRLRPRSTGSGDR